MDPSTNVIAHAYSGGVSSSSSNLSRVPRARRWLFTSYNVDGFSEPEACSFLVYQTEQCPTTGRRHIQGYAEWRNQTVFNTVKSYFADDTVHLTVARGTALDNINYCTKETTRVEGPSGLVGEPGANHQGNRTDLQAAQRRIVNHTSWQDAINDPELFQIIAKHGRWAELVYRCRPQAPPRPEITLRTWQIRCLSILHQPPIRRQILWIWSSESGTGKTTFFDYCSSQFRILPAADYSNTLYAYDGHQIIWYDRTRSQSTNDRSVEFFYSDLEKLSNHSNHTSTKYVTCIKYIACHIVVTANCEPDELRLPNRFVIVLADHAGEPAGDESPTGSDDE